MHRRKADSQSSAARQKHMPNRKRASSRSGSRKGEQSRTRAVLPGSEPADIAIDEPAVKKAGSSASRKRITVSVILKPKKPISTARLGKARLTRAEYRRQHGADPAAVRQVRAFAKESGLTVEQVQLDRRTVQLSGTAAAIEAAFGVTLMEARMPSGVCRVQKGGIQLPRSLAASVEAVLGLDTRPQAKPHFRVFQLSSQARRPKAAVRSRAAGVSYTPVEVAGLYQFPESADAAGQTIALIELGGGYRKADLTAYFKALGQPAPQVVSVSVDGGKNSPGTADGPDGEVMLDIEIAGAVAPGTKIAVYFAPNTDQGFVDAISTAIHDATNKPDVISVSWGSAESNWTGQAMNALDAACQSAAVLGLTITVAAGDNGASDGATGLNVDFPASSPHVMACGGTSLISANGAISSEVVWNDLARGEGATGGGISNVFALPAWQAGVGVPKPKGSSGGRGVPDVAGDADPATGYQVRVDGQTMVIGGTSAVAPLWAGLIALNNQQNARTAGFLQPQIYSSKAKSGFRDITSGNNGGFNAGPGWDACTGLGSPIGARLVQILGAATGSGKKKRGSGAGKKKKSAGRHRAARS